MLETERLVRIRVDAVLDGRDPNEAWAAEVVRLANETAERAALAAERARAKAERVSQREARRARVAANKRARRKPTAERAPLADTVMVDPAPAIKEDA